MKFTLLFGAFPIEQHNDIISNSITGVQFAANALQWSIIDGLEENNINIQLHNLPFIGSYPLRYKKLYYTGRDKCRTAYGTNYKSNKFLNLSLIKMYSRYAVAKNALFSDVVLNGDQNVILIYSVNSPFLRAAINFKNKNPKTIICLIVPDLPEYMSDSQNVFYKYLKRIDGVSINKFLVDIDCFVLLTDFMKDKLPILNKPYVVVEGIYNQNDDIIQYSKKGDGIKQVMYTGTLAKRYGIMNLVNAFHNIQSENYRLLICGDGDSRKDIINLSNIDNRIKYLGNLDRKEVLKLQKESDLLVNPRTQEGDYTKYSFPSKTMEYLASGTPTLLYKLPGIPDEYYDYCYTINSFSVNEFTYRIEEVLNKPLEELVTIGNKARDFILEKKNPKTQCGRIIEMIKNI
jgi:glycosyltransferase involved in cell wall biosynthesis